MKSAFLSVLMFSVISNAKLEVGSQYDYSTSVDGSTYSIRLKDETSGSLRSYLGSSDFKLVKNDDSEIILSLDKPLNFDGFPEKKGTQVYAQTTVSELKIVTTSSSIKIVESGTVTFPDKEDNLPNEKFVDEIQVTEIKKAGLGLSSLSGSQVALPITNDATRFGYIFLKFNYDGTGVVLSSASESELKGSFIFSSVQDNFGQIYTLKIKFSNGDTVEYSGLTQDFGVSEKVVSGTLWSKAKKQTYAFTGRLVYDEKYSEKAPGFITEKIIEGTYSDDVFGVILDFQKEGLLQIKDKSNGKSFGILDWAVANNIVVASRYRIKDGGGLVSSVEGIKECRKNKSCEAYQRRSFTVLKVNDDGLILLRNLESFNSGSPTSGIHLQVLKKVE